MAQFQIVRQFECRGQGTTLRATMAGRGPARRNAYCEEGNDDHLAPVCFPAATGKSELCYVLRC
jgi:hypothetical protein